MADFTISNAVALFGQQNAAINNLWQVYVVATFAAAGYGFSSAGLTWYAAAAVTCGFLVFAAGNLSLILQALRINRALKSDILRLSKASMDASTGPFAPSILCLTNTANRRWVSITAHLIIDACVIVALWSHATGLSHPDSTQDKAGIFPSIAAPRS